MVTENEVLKKIDSGEKLNSDELENLVWDYEVSRIEGENRRWTRTNTSIVVLSGRFFSIEWEEGLTEMQEHEFENQPVEVIKKTTTRTITEDVWVPISEGE